ncbi:hypothetical protein BFP72_14505 [Reichenbachiella sp. 5M10]|uniref:YqaA family protein n=1 Tax=Reichenbachiella sp. 5M10 TaxID=1889772 RepID=UPI000C14470D|nr:VTT domain-containing protein [Reichenbachiella sp. 5M10]PIB36524.1 hypothetical protein BFP72_14505 [Reichenbachiella sp. 5M10]
MNDSNNKYRYLVSNLTKGLLWLAVILILFLTVKWYFEDWYIGLMQELSDKPLLIFATFICSEVFFGIVPPELFMIWALNQGGLQHYIFFTTILAIISYVAGMLGYFIGRQFSHFKLYEQFKKRMGEKLEPNVQRFGGFMIFIAAVTPIPYSAICMLAGAAHYHWGRFVLIGISRLLRFAVYAYIIWHVDKI